MENGTEQYYADILNPFDAELRMKGPHLSKKKILFLHDNAPAHTFATATAKLVELHYELPSHSLYSPDLAHCDFHLFPNLKKMALISNGEVINETEAYFAEFDKSYV